MNLVVIPAGGAAEPHIKAFETAIHVLEGEVETRYGTGLERPNPLQSSGNPEPTMDAQTRNVPGSLYTITVVSLLVAATAITMLFLAGIGYRLEWWELGTAFELLRWAAYLGVAAAALAAVGAALLLRLGRRAVAALAGVAFLAGGIAAGIPYAWQEQARSVPPIHDISTDTVSPPRFIAIAPLRREAPNPAEYAGEETARAQREAYPDIQPLRFAAPRERVFSAAVETAAELGWELVDTSESEGRIEATDTTRWFGFKDDVVIRIKAEDGQTRLDVRSKSRVGRSDVGTNANRIRQFREALSAKLARKG